MPHPDPADTRAISDPLISVPNNQWLYWNLTELTAESSIDFLLSLNLFLVSQKESDCMISVSPIYMCNLLSESRETAELLSLQANKKQLKRVHFKQTGIS